MLGNEKRDSRTMLLDNGDNGKIARKEDIVKNKSEVKVIKQNIRAAHARLLAYTVFAIIGFAIGIFIWQIVLGILGSSLIKSFLGKIIKKDLKLKNKFLRRCVVVLIMSAIFGGCAGYFNLDENLVAACRAFMNPTAVSQVDPYESPNESSKRHKPKKLKAKEQEWLEKQPLSLLETINHILVTEADYEYASKIKLSKDLSNYIFFSGGRYRIEYWDDKVEILSKVRFLIADKREERKKNVFDQKAKQPEMNEINSISEREEKQTEKIVCISDRLNDTNTRSNYYSIMSKASLAMLLANDYHLLALIAFYYGYPDNVIIYYYAKSIEYQLEYISLKEVSDETVKEKLIWISTRYEDIVFTCNGTKEASWAEELAKAFSSLSRKY